MDSLYSSSQHQVINKIPISPSSEKDDSSSEAFTMFDATYSDPLYSNSSTIASNPRVLVSPECKKTIRRVVTLSGTLCHPLLLAKQQQQQQQLSEQQNQCIPPSSQGKQQRIINRIWNGARKILFVDRFLILTLSLSLKMPQILILMIQRIEIQFV